MLDGSFFLAAREAVLGGARFDETNFAGAALAGAALANPTGGRQDLRGARNLTLGQLAAAKSWFPALLPDSLDAQRSETVVMNRGGPSSPHKRRPRSAQERSGLRRYHAPPRPMESRAQSFIRLFISYSHKDEAFRNELDDHLSLLRRQGIVDTWHDRKIVAGDDWVGEIDENLEAADIVLLLVSASFLASDYCYDKEMKRALERHDAGEARVVPVAVRECVWRGAPFARLQAVPTDAKAVEEWGSRHAAWKNVVEGLVAVIDEFRG